MVRISIYSALSCSALIAANTLVSKKGCSYEDLPSENEMPIEGQPNIAVPIHGEWKCKKNKDHCDLKCDDGYGPFIGHVLEHRPEVNVDDPEVRLPATTIHKLLYFDQMVTSKAKKVFCNSKTKQWQPAKVYKRLEDFPRCHNTCEELNLNIPEDTSAKLACINLLGKVCTPGVDCHHGATCYVMGGDRLATQDKPKRGNGMRCACTNQEGCEWDVPEDNPYQIIIPVNSYGYFHNYY